MKIILCSLTILIFQYSYSQSVKNTSFTNQAGEKVLRLEIVLPVNLETAWQLFTKDEHLKKWIAPVAHIELKPGGYILTNYDAAKPLSDSSSIKMPIINFLDKKMITLKVDLNNNFSEGQQNADENLKEIIEFKKIDSIHTKIISTMIGFGIGNEWDKTFDFFTSGNIWTYNELIKLYKNKGHYDSKCCN